MIKLLKHTFRTLLSCALVASVVGAAEVDATPEAKPDAVAVANVEFAKDVVPVLNKYCVGCHAADSAEADLALDTFAALLKGGENGSTIDQKNLDGSLLLQRLADPDSPMPPEDEPKPTAAELAMLVSWVKAGAKPPARDIDPTIVKFDSIEPSDAPSPVTAIAFGGQGNSTGDIVFVSPGVMSGLSVKSAGGFLAGPPGGTQAPAAPFTFLLANDTKHFAAAAIPGSTIEVDGEFRMSLRYTGTDPANDLKVKYGDAKFQQQEMEFRVESGRVAVAAFGEVRTFEGLKAAKASHKLKTPGKVHALRFTAKGDKLLAASGIAGVRGEAILWDAANGKVLQRFTAHNDAIYCVDISRDGRLVATGSYDRNIILWDAESGELLRTLKGHNGAVYDLAFSPDGKVLVSASADATVKVWNVASGERLDTLGQPLKEQYSVAISPDGRNIIAGGEDNRIRMWSLVSVDKPQINPIVSARFAHEGAVEQVRFSPDGKYIVSSSSDKTVKIWSPSLELLNAYDIPVDTTETLAVSTDGTIAVGTMDGKVKTMPLRVAKQNKESSPQSVAVKASARAKRKLESYTEAEPNNETTLAQTITVPAKVSGVIHNDSADAADADVANAGKVDRDVYQFRAKAGETWILEINAARNKSPLDSHIAILNEVGEAVRRVQLQAVRDTYFTFRGKDSNGTGDFRMHNWEEMRLNQYLYASGEVVRLYHYPRGPDSGFNVYPNFGSRRGYYDTTPLAHALHEPAYIVEPHPPGVELPPNGLPVFTLNYENDDDSQRRLGDDSRLTFVAPKDGEYFVVVRDIRDSQGEDFKYDLTIRAPKPDYKGKVLNENPVIAPGTGKKFGIEIERIDGFAGAVDISVRGLPEGFTVPGPLQVEPGHDRVWATIIADEGAKTPDEEVSNKVEIVAAARVDGEIVERTIGPLGKIKVEESAKLLVDLTPDHEPTMGDAQYPVVELKAGSTTTATIRITRKDHKARVGFGSEDGAVNAPHGVYVDNIGLNGVLIVEGQNERQFFITAEPWVKPMERVIFVESGDAGRPTSNPVILRILPADQPGPTDQVSR